MEPLPPHPHADHSGTPTPARRFFRSSQRLSHALEFRAVFDARMRKSAGPLALFLKPNNAGAHRLGLSIGRIVGNAVARNRVKRMIREAFRLHLANLPLSATYDFVISAKPHGHAPLETYARTLTDLAIAADKDFQRRRDRSTPPTTPTPAPPPPPTDA